MRAALLTTLLIAAGAYAGAALYRPDLLPSPMRFGAADKTAPPNAHSSADAVPGATRRSRSDVVVVEASPARQARASGDIRAVGSLMSDESVHVASEVAGRVAEIPFVEGQPIKANDVIVRLDEALAKAEVADAKARLELAKANNERANALVRTGAVTERTRDEAVSNFETATAGVALAETRLEKHTLRAPFDGVAGVRNVSVGAFIAVGSPIVNVEKIDTLKVDFKAPEIYLRQIEVGQKLAITVDAIPGKTFDGEIYAIDPHIDVNGRALTIRARLPNPDFILRPGLFARITIQGLASREVTLIPESAIVPRGGEAFVFRVDNGKAVESRVKLGARKDAEVEILEGLDPKATVVTAGQQKLRNGSAVEIIAATPAAPVDPEAPAAKQSERLGRSG
ncbi:MAG: efflux RND transporter periplasmic adaptor subunit [Hyphomicrobium sp.]